MLDFVSSTLKRNVSGFGSSVTRSLREMVSSAIPMLPRNQTHGGRAHTQDTWGDADVAVRFPTPLR